MSNMLIFLAFDMVLPTIPVYLSHHGSDQSMIGMITAIISFAAVVIRLFTGRALDRYNRRSIVIGGSLAFAAAVISFAFSLSVIWTIASSVLLGFAWGIVTVAYATIVSGLIPVGRQGSGIGTFMIFAMASMAVGPFLGGWLYNEYGSLILFGTSGAIASLSLFVFLYKNEGQAKLAPNTSERATNEPFLTGIFEKSSLFPSLLALLFMFSFGGILSFAGLYGHELGVANGGLFLLLSNAAAVAIRPIAGKLFDTKGHASVLIPGSIVGITGLLMLSTASGPATFLLAALVYGLSFGALQPYLQAWTIQRAPPARQGAANSTFMIGVDTGVALGSIALGFWAHALGYASSFRIAGIIVISQLLIYCANLLIGTRSDLHRPHEQA